MSGEGDEAVDKALGQLREVITERVRAEQVRDQLTGLQNQLALRAAIEAAIDAQQDFWVAFIEVNRFKSVNDQFGYEAADAMLVGTANVMRLARGFFVGQTRAFRPHGDEFFLMGPLPESTDKIEIRPELERIRDTIGALKVETPQGVMAITVSIGWLVSSDVAEVLRYRSVMRCLERAVSVAKKDRHTICRFDPTTPEAELISLRGDCPKCASKWALDIERKKNLDQNPAFCPNCGTNVQRPPMPGPLTEVTTLDVAAPSRPNG